MDLPAPIIALVDKVSRQEYVKSQEYINAAFELNIRLVPLEIEFRKRSQDLSLKKLDIFRAQEKRNVAAAELEIQSTNEYREVRELEDLIEHIKRSIQIAKKASDLI